MIICSSGARFGGRVRPGMYRGMRGYVNDVLAPLWRQFDAAHTVRVLFGVEQHPDGPSFPLVLAITYLDAVAMACVLAMRSEAFADGDPVVRCRRMKVRGWGYESRAAGTTLLCGNLQDRLFGTPNTRV